MSAARDARVAQLYDAQAAAVRDELNDLETELGRQAREGRVEDPDFFVARERGPSAEQFHKDLMEHKDERLALHKNLMQEVRSFDRTKLTPEGRVLYVSKRFVDCCPKYHGFVYVDGHEGSGRIYGYGADPRRMGFKLCKKDYAYIKKYGRIPDAIINTIESIIGHEFPSHEAFIAAVKAKVGKHNTASRSEWRTWERKLTRCLEPRAGRLEITSRTVSEFMASCRAGEPARTGLEKALSSLVARRFRTAKDAIFTLKETLGENIVSKMPAWDRYQRKLLRYNGSNDYELWPRPDGAMQQADEDDARAAFSNVSFREYPQLRHEYVREAWRRDLVAASYLDEKMMRGALTAQSFSRAEGTMPVPKPPLIGPEDEAVIRQRCIENTGAEHPYERDLREMRNRFTSRFHSLPGLRCSNRQGWGNCNSGSGGLMRQALRLQERDLKRQGEKPPKTPRVRGAGCCHVGIDHEIRMWDGVDNGAYGGKKSP